MATLTINGRSVSADPEQTILEAARGGGILDIPTLCWYPKLPVVGNCRICLVSVEGQAKLLPACATKVADGMVVQTESHAAVENRTGVLRLLLERYPGEHLRNGSREGTRSRNEFEEYVLRYGVVPTPIGERDLVLRHGDERPGDPMIRHDMSTCILCTRCVRACEDIQVVGVLDVGQRGEHTEIIVGAGRGRPWRVRARPRSRRARRARWERRCGTCRCSSAWTWKSATAWRRRPRGTSRSARPHGTRCWSSRRRSCCVSSASGAPLPSHASPRPSARTK